MQGVASLLLYNLTGKQHGLVTASTREGMSFVECWQTHKKE